MLRDACESLEVPELAFVFVVRQRLDRLFVELIEVARVAGAFSVRHERWRHLQPIRSITSLTSLLRTSIPW